MQRLVPAGGGGGWSLMPFRVSTTTKVSERVSNDSRIPLGAHAHTYFSFKGCALFTDRRRGPDGCPLPLFAAKETATSDPSSTKVYGTANAEQYAQSQ